MCSRMLEGLQRVTWAGHDLIFVSLLFSKVGGGGSPGNGKRRGNKGTEAHWCLRGKGKQEFWERNEIGERGEWGARRQGIEAFNKEESSACLNAGAFSVAWWQSKPIHTAV